jgi:hypothetical protein
MLSLRSRPDGSTPLVRSNIGPLFVLYENFLKAVFSGVMAAAHNLDLPLPLSSVSKNLPSKSNVFAVLDCIGRFPQGQ